MTKPLVAPKPPHTKPGAELTFAPWEEKLLWVKKYKELLLKDNLSENDCNELPSIRLVELSTHETWANDPQKCVNPTETQAIHEKFQTAVDNIILKFCTPIEGRYSSTIARLKQQAPQSDDHEKFDDEFKAQYIAAASVRYSAATNLLYNPTASARFFSRRLTTAEDARLSFIHNKAEFTQRYIDCLRLDHRLLQNRFSELIAVEKTLDDCYGNNEKLIRALKHDIVSSIEQIRRRLTDLAPISSTITHDTIPPAPPCPPPFPIFLLPPQRHQSTLPHQREKSNIDIVQSSKPHAISLAALQTIRLKPSSHRLTVIPRGANPQPTPHAPTQKTPIKSGIRSSIKELEDTIEKNALNIYKEEQIISVIHERNNHQIKVLASLNKHKKLLEKLAEETTLLESQNNQANKSAIETFGAVACLSIGGLAPPPPPPPPPPPIAGLKISFSQPKPQIESVNAPCQKTNISTAIHTQKTAVSAELKARIIARRNVLEQDMPDNNSFSDKRAAEQEKQKNQQKQEQQATLAKYAEHAKEKFALPFSAHKAECDVRTSAIKIKIQKIDAEIEHLSGDETIAQLTRDLHLLARSPRPLITEAPPRVTDQPAIHKPLIAEVLPRMINQSTVHKPLVEKSQPSLRPQVSILQEKITLSQDAIIKKVQQASTQQQNYLSRVKAIMGQNEITVLKFYLAKNNNMLHVALEKLNPDNLNKAIIIDVLIISNYVERKRLEIKKKKLSPEVGSIYTRSLDAFYKEALSIRLSNENTNVQRIRLEEAANKHFKPRHANFRRFADVFIMIGTLFVGGLIIGLGRVALGHKFFFSQEESTRANDFKKHLRDSNFNNEGLLHGDFSPENRNPG